MIEGLANIRIDRVEKQTDENGQEVEVPIKGEISGMP